MFDFVRSNRRIVQLVLAGITLPFAFWGVESYVSNVGASNDVATVGGSKISHQEFLQSLQTQQDRLRSAAGRPVPQEMLDTPEIRQEVLNNLIDQRLLLLHASKVGIGVGDAQLAQFIASVPSLQEGGKFSKEKYEALVAAQNMSKEVFEARLRQDMSIQQALGAVSAAMPGRSGADRWLTAQLEEREIAELSFTPEQFQGQVKLGADASKTYYESHRSVFEVPEQVRVEFVALTRQALMDQVSVSDEEAMAWYKGHADQYRQPEERRASHILILADKNADGAAVKTASSKAEDLLAKIRKAPGDFAVLARQNSQDPGSAAKGGDLDWFRRGMMVKPFDDAAFALKEGEVSGVVRSDFGFHIIKLTGLKPEKIRAFEEVRGEILAQLSQQTAARKFTEATESFSNIVYEQADSLQPAVDKFKLKSMQSGWFTKDGKGAGPLGHPKLLAAVFSDDAIKNKRNTEAVEVAPDTLVSARVLEHKPAALRPLEEVKGEIEQHLVREEAVKLARQAGEAAQARAGKGDAEFKWGASRSVPRLGAANIGREELQAIFKADGTRMPAYAGAARGDGSYVLYRISQIRPFKGGDEDSRVQALRQQYSRVVAGEEFSAWLGSLRQHYGVEIHQKALETKER
ncbi:SurA N-terminal domain-containing protein [Denitratisoma oestradiolicum]|uniref:Periplasmic chaperone PpiD n=1 Tax=Denitratisoma oestradiolicum TaxID=311182 RepID=A0A6S6XRG9_9PROT|nr:SurA N-terminal domain-containing protein [Denitratisoma oestradiolicum]TWO81375.1 hypothetical protein CBW56_04495 [Denitratisoma oestradiolicum]CAB1368571.1 Peptidylprolyl isomerase [Denitratisoma oestradiolicum]